MGLLLQKIYKLSHSFILSRSRCRRTHTEIGQEYVWRYGYMIHRYRETYLASYYQKKTQTNQLHRIKALVGGRPHNDRFFNQAIPWG